MLSGLLRFHQLSAPFSCRIQRIMKVMFSSVTGQSPSMSTSLAQSSLVPDATSVSGPVVVAYDSCDTAGAATSAATLTVWVSPESVSVAAVGAVTASGCGASAKVSPSASTATEEASGASRRARRAGDVRAPLTGLAAPCRAARRPPGGRWSVSRMRGRGYQTQHGKTFRRRHAA